jgi:single-strand DNA-binding protein
MLNKVQIIGNLGTDVCIETARSGITYATLSLGNNRTWKDRDGERQKTVTWVDVVAFNGLAQSLEPLTKGDQVAVAGRLQNKYDENGKIRGLEIVAEEIDFLRVKTWQQ